MERRAFLIRGVGAAGVAGAAWVAPTVLSVDAAAAQTAPPPDPPDFSSAGGLEGGPGATDLTLNLPAGTFDVGDYLLALGLIRFTNAKNAGVAPPSITPPNAWTPIVPPNFDVPGGVTSRPTPLATNTTQALRGHLFGYRYNGEASFTFTKTNNASGNPTYWAVLVVGYSGVDATTPLDGAAGQGQVSTDVTAPTITTTAAGTRVVYLGGSIGPTTWSGPPSYTFRAEAPSAAPHPEGRVADVVPASAGATGPVTATIVTPTDPAQLDNVGFLVGLRPA